MIKLLSALPNSLLAPQEGYTVTVTAISKEKAKNFLSTNAWESSVGHDSTALLFSEGLGFPIKSKRVNVTLDHPDCLLAGLFTPPHRLEEGQRWTEEQILAMEIRWVLVQKYPTDVIEIVDAANNYQPCALLWN
jgi:hypothetical protein